MPASKPLTPWQQNLLNKVRTQGYGSAQEMMRELGPNSGLTLEDLSNDFAASGEKIPTSIAQGMAAKARTAMASGQLSPLDEWSMNAYQGALARGVSARGFAGELNRSVLENPTYGNTTIDVDDVETILKGAGLKLPVRKAYGKKGAGYMGQTDVIMTGARGATGNALLKRKLLTGAR